MSTKPGIASLENEMSKGVKINWVTLWDSINPYVIIIGISLFAVYAAIVQPEFASGQNLQNIVRQFGALSLTAIGMTFVIIAGFIDLSIVGMFSLVSVTMVTLVPIVGEVPAMLIGILFSTLLGFFDGMVLSFVGAKDDADAVFVTFGMSTIFFSLALMLSQGSTIRLPIGSSVSLFIGSHQFFYLPISFYIFLVVMTITHIFLMKTKTGREIRLTGGNRVAAKLAGISSVKSTLISFSLLGLTVALGAIIQFSRTTSAGPIIGAGFEVNSILAVVIGGTRLKGGEGSVIRTFIGVLLVVVMANAMNMIGVPTKMQDIVKGAILMLAIWLDYRRK